MEIAKNTPRAAATIQGASVQIPEPFVEGHVVTTAEANALNQTVRENVRNNLATKVKNLEEAQRTDENVQKIVDEYMKEYEIGARRTGGSGSSLTPREAEAKKIATERVKAAVKAKGYNLSGDGDNVIDKGQLSKLISDYAEKEEVLAEADRRLKATEKLSVEGLGL